MTSACSSPISLSHPSDPNHVLTVTCSKKRSTKPQVKTACVNCKKAHLACDLSRPCKRCISSDKADSCHDIQHKKRGRPKLRTMKPHHSPAFSPSTPSSSFTMTSHEQQQDPRLTPTTMVMFLSMELCCARVSDESFDFLGLYPQEFSHRSLYDFIHPKHSNTVARIHRYLLDNAVTFSTTQKRLLPPTERTTADMFVNSSPYQLLTIANGSLTLKESLFFKTSDQSRHQPLEARFYLGGGTGADLDQSDSLHRLYIVCSLTMPTSHNYPDADLLQVNGIKSNQSVTNSIQQQTTTVTSQASLVPSALQPILFQSPPLASSSSSSSTSSSLEQPTSLVINNNNTTTTVDMTDTWTTTSSSSPSSFSTLSHPEDKEGSSTSPFKPPPYSSHHQNFGSQQPYQLYYQSMLSSRLSGEAQSFASATLRRSSPVMSTPPYTARRFLRRRSSTALPIGGRNPYTPYISP